MRKEFIQHEFERLHPFCLLIYITSISVWVVFDLIVSFVAGQGYTRLSMLFCDLSGQRAPRGSRGAGWGVEPVVREQQTLYPVTISIGLARVEDADILNQALIKADEALYESKHSGKDRLTFH